MFDSLFNSHWFDNQLFTSQIWEWFIIIPTLGGIAGCLFLIIWMSGSRPKPDEKVKTMGHVWDENLEELNNPLPMWWLNMFYITLIFGVFYLIVFPGLGSYKGMWEWTEVKAYEQEMKAAKTKYDPIYEKYQEIPIADLAKDETALKIGQRLFANYCTICHGSDAHGIKGFPNLTDNDWLYGSDPKTIETSIMKGRQGAMPNLNLSDDEINTLAPYVLSLSGSASPSAEVIAKGKELFTAKTCIVCHGPEAKGTQAMGAPNLTDKTWLYGGTEADIKLSLAKGRQGKMPAHGDFLGKAKVHLLATYIYSLSANK
jgi:cytochrome c oxidase cbb3-type subunit 3